MKLDFQTSEQQHAACEERSRGAEAALRAAQDAVREHKRERELAAERLRQDARDRESAEQLAQREVLF